MKWRRKLFKFYNFILIFLLANSILLAQDNIDIPLHDRELVSGKLGWDDHIEVIIEEISYRKDRIASKEIGKELYININELKDFFLERAVIVTGMEVNCSFLYESVSIYGKVITDKREYSFYYNLAGFCRLYLEKDGTPIIIADPELEVPMVP